MFLSMIRIPPCAVASVRVLFLFVVCLLAWVWCVCVFSLCLVGMAVWDLITPPVSGEGGGVEHNYCIQLKKGVPCFSLWWMERSQTVTAYYSEEITELHRSTHTCAHDATQATAPCLWPAWITCAGFFWYHSHLHHSLCMLFSTLVFFLYIVCAPFPIHKGTVWNPSVCTVSPCRQTARWAE